MKLGCLSNCVGLHIHLISIKVFFLNRLVAALENRFPFYSTRLRGSLIRL